MGKKARGKWAYKKHTFMGHTQRSRAIYNTVWTQCHILGFIPFTSVYMIWILEQIWMLNYWRLSQHWMMGIGWQIAHVYYYTGFPAHQGKLFYIFPVREKSGNLRKMPQIREKSGNFDWPVSASYVSTKTGN